MVGLQDLSGSRVRHSGSQGFKGETSRFPGGQGVGFQDPRGSRSRPSGSQGVIRYIIDTAHVGPPEVVQEVLADLKSVHKNLSMGVCPLPSLVGNY